MKPKVTFHFSLEVGAIYALEMALQAHGVKVEVRNLPKVFDDELLQEFCNELSLTGFFWHVRGLTSAANLKAGLERWVKCELYPLLEEVVKYMKGVGMEYY